MKLEATPVHPAGPLLSPAIWGTWRCVETPALSTPDRLAPLLEYLLELGVTTFDLADIYGGYRSEQLFGAALKLTGVPRGSVQFVGKADICPLSPQRPQHRLKHYDTTPEHLQRTVARTLEMVQSDYLDVLLLHRPDPLMDADATAAAFEQMALAGTVRSFGVSNHTPAQIELLQSRLSRPLVSNQIEVSPLHTGPLFDGTLDQAQRLRMRPMIWSPLGGGRLFRPSNEAEQRVAVALDAVGIRAGLDRAETALAWLATMPSRPLPILGTGDRERLAGQARACSVRLDRQDWFVILEAALGSPVA
jgi:predicted oxidoreductase